MMRRGGGKRHQPCATETRLKYFAIARVAKLFEREPYDRMPLIVLNAFTERNHTTGRSAATGTAEETASRQRKPTTVNLDHVETFGS